MTGKYIKLDADNYIWGYAFSDGSPGVGWLEVEVDIETAQFSSNVHQLVNGLIVDTEEPIFPPEAHLTWNNGWVDERSLQEYKDAKWEEMKAERQAQEFSTVTYNGNVYDADALSQQRIQGAAQLAVLDANISVDWTLLDNSVVTLTAAEIIGLGIALGVHVTAAYNRGRTVRVEVESATTKAEVDAITWIEP